MNDPNDTAAAAPPPGATGGKGQEEAPVDSYESMLRPQGVNDGALYISVLQDALRFAATPAHAPAPPITGASATSVQAQRSLRGLKLLLVAGLCGVSGDLLLRPIPSGINVALWLGVTLLVVSIFWRKEALPSLGVARWLVVPLLVFALAFAWRDSLTLRWLDALGSLTCLCLLAMSTRAGKLWLATMSEYLQAVLQFCGNWFTGILQLLFQEIRWRELPQTSWSKQLVPLVRGLLLVVPLLLLFGSLLASADFMFSQLLSQLFAFQFDAIAVHSLRIGSITWLVASYLFSLVFRPEAPLTQVSPGASPQRLNLGFIEAGMVLTALNGLFLAFVLVQFRYLFFGALHFPVGAGTAYAHYARGGFFELVTVSMLVLPLLLALDYATKRATVGQARFFRFSVGLQLGLLFVIMASAVQRMRLYQICCGLTELRIYTMAFMGWLALVFGWFACTVLRGQRERFAFGAVLAGFAVLASLHFVNPDALIARVNLQRAASGLPLDVDYVTALSADSLPSLLAELPILPPGQRTQITERLRHRVWDHPTSDWRGWNYARRRAVALAAQFQLTMPIQTASLPHDSPQPTTSNTSASVTTQSSVQRPRAVR